MFFLYNLLVSILFLLFLPLSLLLILLKTELVIGEFAGRLGFYSKEFYNYIKTTKQAKKDLLWVHAASVGEVTLAKPIIEELAKSYPDLEFIISTNSSSGMKMAEKLFGPERSILIPLDLPWLIKSLVTKVNPKMAVFVEYEAWPNLINCLANINSRLVLVNGSMDKKIFRFYHLFPGLLRFILNKFDFLCMQSIEEVEKVKALGVEHSKIKLTGNMKFDNYSKTSDTIGSAGLRERLRIPEDAFVFIAGSTHAGEERVVFKIYQEINKKFGNFFLIIAPRHIERAQKIKRLGQRYNLIPIESTKIESLTPAQSGKHVIILDTIGELANLYSIANVAFVGGSLINNGGHNLLEPVIYGKPVFFGPYIQDFKALAHMLSKYKIGFMVKSKEMLRDGILEFYDQERQLLIEQRAREFLAQNEGATKRSINIIKSFHVINGGNRDE